MTAYVLAAGKGRRMSPYGECRPKCLLPVLNRPVLSHITDALSEAGSDRTVVAAGRFASSVRNVVQETADVEVREVGETNGAAETLLKCMTDADEPTLVLYGDVLVDPSDIDKLLRTAESRPMAVTLLVSQISAEESGDWIVARLDGERVRELVGHPRSTAAHRVAGFVLPRRFRRWLEACPNHFPNVEVGMMPPPELHLEAAVESYRASGNEVFAVVSSEPTVDLDKPWHILLANELWLARRCARLTAGQRTGLNRTGSGAGGRSHAGSDPAGHQPAEGSHIDGSASVEGSVLLGKNSRIGKNVIVRGSLIAGDNVVIDSGAILNGNVAVGDGSFVGNACFVEGGSVIGRRCVVSHAAELSGVIFDGVYLYHYMEIYGIVGENTDIGAATVCGSLRFDDGATAHRIQGRREIPRHHSNATFIGDFCRTGVNAIIMPGKKIGPYSIVGAGVLLEEDLPQNTGIRVKQEQERFTWGPNRYGW